MLLKDTNYIGEKEFTSIAADISEILKVLISIVKIIKSNIKNSIINYPLSIVN